MTNQRKTTPQFVEEAQRVHGEKFDYSCCPTTLRHVLNNKSKL